MIERIRLENWRTHKDTVLEFGKGTNVLIGKSGAGKTSVMDGICFALFGTFPVVQRKEASLDRTIMSKPHAMDFATVELEFTHNNSKYKIERWIHTSKTPQAKLYENNRLIAGPKVTEVTERVQALLELDYDLFSRAIYSEQNQMDYFLKLSAQQRKQKFDSMLELDRYECVRAHAVKVKNRIRLLKEERDAHVQDTQARLPATAVPELETKITAQQHLLNSSQLNRVQLEQEVLALEERIRDLVQLSKKFEECNAHVLQWNATIASLESELKDKKLDAFTSDNVIAELTAIHSTVQVLEKKQLECTIHETEWKNAQSLVHSLESQLTHQMNRLPKTASSFADWKFQLMERDQKIKTIDQRVQSFEKNLRETETEFVHASEQVKVLEAKLLEEHQLVHQLERAQAQCPICKRSLETAQKRSIALDSKNHVQVLSAEIQRFKQKSLDVKTSLDQHRLDFQVLQSQLMNLKEERVRFAELEQVFKDIKDLSLQITEARHHLTVLETSVKSQSSSNIANELAAVRLKEKELEELHRLFLKQADAVNARTHLSKAQLQLTELQFHPSDLESARSQFEQKKERIRSLGQEQITLQQLLVELQVRLKELRDQQTALDALRDSVQELVNAEDTLTVFTNALLETQAELRTHLVDTLNQAMNDLWSRVYPYSDYIGLRLDILDGSYELQVCSRTHQWLPVEGMLSGGEKSTAALILRIAFSLVLARNLNWLILDEPTHNLDALLVSRLSLLLRDHLPELVDQVFLITHDKEMENAASATLYILERDKDNDGITKPELQL